MTNTSTVAPAAPRLPRPRLHASPNTAAPPRPTCPAQHRRAATPRRASRGPRLRCAAPPRPRCAAPPDPTSRRPGTCAPRLGPARRPDPTPAPPGTRAPRPRFGLARPARPALRRFALPWLRPAQHRHGELDPSPPRH
nr:uncharacterized protein LOC127339374 [Lolium perenne]